MTNQTDALWRDAEQGDSTWTKFGPFQIQGQTYAEDGDDKFSACVQIIDDDGTIFYEKDIEGRPTLQELRTLAIAHARELLELMEADLKRLAHE